MADSYPGAAPVPDGATADLANPQDVLRTINYATQALTMFIVTIFVALKIYAKMTVLGGTHGWEDYTAYVAYVLMLGYCICAIFLSEYGGGLNMWEVPKSDVEPFLKSAYAVTIHYAPMTLFCKLALLFIISRVFGSVYKKTVRSIYVLMGLLAAYYISGVIIKIRICWPISAYWEGDHDKCLDQSAIITADSIISVVSDLVILLLPTPLTWSLRLPMKKKLRVIGMLCAGGLATAFSIYRLGIVVVEGSSANQSVVFIKIVLTGTAEVGIGLICACLPSVSALVIRRKQGYIYSASRSRDYARSKGGEGTMTGTRIYVNRDFHMETSVRTDVEKEVGSNAFELSDDSQLVAHAQANPNDAWSTKSSSG